MPKDDPLEWLLSGEKTNPGAVDTDSIDDELWTRYQRGSEADALKWLNDGDIDAADPLLIPQEVETPANAGILDMSGRALKDIISGAMETPRQMLGGARDAFQEMNNLADEAGDWLSENVKDLGSAQLLDKEGNFDPRYFGPGEKSADETGLTLPEVKGPLSVTGQGIRSISQFMTGFVTGGKAMKGIKATTQAGKLAKAAAQGAFSDFSSFSGHQERLANLVENNPALKNPVTEFLAANPKDKEVEGRLKNAVEGLGLGLAAEGVFRAFKLYRSIANARRAASPAAAADQQIAKMNADPKATLREAQGLNLLGNDISPLVTRKMGQSAKETELPVPDDVAVHGLTQTKAGGEDVFINFARINSPDDIQNVMGQMADAFSTGVNEARRGVRSNAETVKSADAENAWQILIERRKGEPLNAEQSFAARQLWETAAGKLYEVAKAAEVSPTPENLFQFRRMLTVTNAIQKEVIGARTETARALQQWAIPAGGGKQQMKHLQDALETMGGEEASQELAKRIIAAGESGAPYATIAKLTEKGAFARTLDAVHEYWINALLSGPKTHIVNAISNASVAGLSMLERGIAARISQLSGEQGVEVGEALAQLHGMKSALRDAFSNAAKAFKTGQSGMGVNKIEVPRTRNISSSNFNLNSDSWLGAGVDALGAAVNTSGRALQTSDEFYKTIGYRAELHSLALRTAMQDVRAGRIPNKPDAIKDRMADVLSNPPEGIQMDAAAEAAYRTFTSDAGPWTRKIQQIRNTIPGGRYVLPFTGTPANIIKYTFERTPLAPVTARYRAAIRKGGPDAAIARARLTLGTSMMLVAGDLAQNGVITGSGPSNPAERAAWLRAGNRPYSFQFGNKSIAYNRLDPTGFIFGMAADISEYSRNADYDEELTAQELEEVFSASAFAVAENLNNKSYLQGFAMLTEALSDTKRFAPSYVEKLASSFVPAIVGEASRAIDPTMRASQDIMSSLQRKVPFWNESLPPMRDLYGRARTYESGFGTAYDTLSPMYGATANPEPIDQEMLKSGFALSMPSKSLTIDKQDISLKNRSEVYSRFLELQGATKPSKMTPEAGEQLEGRFGDRTMLETLNDVVTGKDADLSESYQSLEDPEDKKNFLTSRVVKPYRDAARAQIKIEFPDLQAKADRVKARRRVPEMAN